MERKKIAVILSRFPYPIDKGDKLRAYHQIRCLSLNHDIYLFALADVAPTENDLHAMQPFCKEMKVYTLRKIEIAIQVMRSFLQSLPVQSLYFYSSRIAQQLQLDLNQVHPDVVYCQLSRTAFYAKDLDCRKVLDFQDAFAMNYDRIQAQSKGLKQWFYKRESALMRQFEANILRWFDHTTIISEFDKSQLSVQPNKCVVVGNGIDTAYFAPRTSKKKYDVFFAGNLNYLPNKLALDYLLAELFPLLLKAKPDITIQISGGDPKEFHALANKYPKHIFLQGWVDDIRAAYAESRVFVAPLFTGAGVQNKILEAMSMKIPCVTTPIVNASLNALENQQLYLAKDAVEFRDKILYLLSNPDQANLMTDQAKKFVHENFSWEKNSIRLERLF